MTEDARRGELARLLEEFHRRRALGEAPAVESYRETAGEHFEEFRRVLETEAALDAAISGPEPTPFPIAFGAYTLLREIGRGAAGVVYEAIHRGLGRKVALKVLKSDFDSDASLVERFRREARACAQVRHDHIVEVYEAGEQEGRYFYAMALLEGRPLPRTGCSGDDAELRELAAHVAGVADALHALHERGIVHRDVKPSNIIEEPSGRLVLADFGLARTVASESLTMTGQSLGTPLYMSPEQMLGSKREVDGRTDVYGLGATLYEVLAGRPVFQEEDLAALMRLVLTERPRPLRQAAPSLPADLERIVMKALEKRPEDRYASAAALRDDLLAFARGGVVTGRPLTPVQRALRRTRSQLAWLLPAAGLLIAAGLYLALRPPDPARITIASTPEEVEVFVDGESRGPTPVALAEPPGVRTLLLRKEGWEDHVETRRLEPGQLWTLDLVMRPLDPTDPDAIDAIATALKLRTTPWEQPETERSGGGARSVLLLFPRGEVRREDLDRYSFLLRPDFAGRGAIVFRIGERDVYRREVDDDWPPELSTEEAVPQEVLRELEPGTRVSWGFAPAQGPAVLAEFRLTTTDLSDRAAELEQRLADQDPLVRRQLLAQLHLDHGLFQAAYREARAVADDTDQARRALAVMKGALEGLGLKGGALWNDLVRRSRR